ncbi:MAG: DUF4270 family protein [Flavobacteriales bacterium]
MTAFLVLSAIVISSCKKDEQTIGLDAQPDSDFLTVNQKTVALSAELLRTDSIRTNLLAESFIGHYRDPEFGETNTIFYAQLELPGSNLDLGNPDSLEVDSVILTLKTTGQIHGNPFLADVSVFELSESLFRDTTYFSDDVVQTFSNDLKRDDVNLVRLTNGTDLMRSDSLYSAIRIPLDNEIGENWLNQFSTPILENDSSFQNYFKGIALVTNTAGAVLGIDANSSLSAVNIYYRDNGVIIDTLETAFQIDNGSTYFNFIEHNYSMASFSVPNDSSNQEIHLQGMGGVRAKLDLSQLETEIVGTPGTVLAKAEIIMPIRNLNSTVYPPPFNLFLTTGEIADSLSIVLDQLATINIGGTLDISEEEYVFNCTQHIQRILQDELELKPFWLSVNPPSSLQSLFSASFSSYNSALPKINRVVLNGPESSSIDPVQNMRLVLTYSE